MWEQYKIFLKKLVEKAKNNKNFDILRNANKEKREKREKEKIEAKKKQFICEKEKCFDNVFVLNSNKENDLENSEELFDTMIAFYIKNKSRFKKQYPKSVEKMFSVFGENTTFRKKYFEKLKLQTFVDDRVKRKTIYVNTDLYSHGYKTDVDIVFAISLCFDQLIKQNKVASISKVSLSWHGFVKKDTIWWVVTSWLDVHITKLSSLDTFCCIDFDLNDISFLKKTKKLKTLLVDGGKFPFGEIKNFDLDTFYVNHPDFDRSKLFNFLPKTLKYLAWFGHTRWDDYSIDSLSWKELYTKFPNLKKLWYSHYKLSLSDLKKFKVKRYFDFKRGEINSLSINKTRLDNGLFLWYLPRWGDGFDYKLTIEELNSVNRHYDYPRF